MPIANPFHPFDGAGIAKAPEVPGVYQLETTEVVYIGKATASIRDRLQAHNRGDEGPCTRNATWYRCEPHPNPAARERQLLGEYQSSHGSLPRCNDVMP
ncbi:MAG: GIY-YIG nuclease family protein [Gemmatimonadales bacterium]|nr:GIY-YIG nuclease family protein [Gemmatimonadales bacterium]